MTSYKVALPYPFQESGWGGVHRVMQSIVSNSSSDFEFEAVTPPPSDAAKANIGELINFRIFKRKLPGWGIDYRRPAVKSILEEYDLVWCNSHMINHGIADIDTPLVTTFHSVERGSPLGIPKNIDDFKDIAEWKLINRGIDSLQKCERVVCVSDRSRNVVERRTSANAVRIYNGADYLGSEQSEADDGYIFAADNSEIALYIASEIEYPLKILHGSNNLKRKAKKLDIDAEFIEGYISDEELAELYKNCSFYISGSYSDGFGLTPLEANHFGKPCLVFDKEVHKENIEDGVNGYACANTYEMVQRARELAENEEKRHSMGESAYNYVKDKFTWEKAARRYEEEFRSVVE